MFSMNVLSRLMMVLAISNCAGIAAAQNLREAAREQAVRNPGVPLDYPAPPGLYVPKTVEELGREADIVLVAELSRINSYLGPAEDHVLTDYSIEAANVIAGRLPIASSPAPTATAPLTLTVYGGEVVVESVLIPDQNREVINDGGRYLLFLRQSRRCEVGRYELYHAGIFDVSEGEVKPLLKQADRVFKGISGARVNDVISRVKAAVQAR